MQAKKVIIKAFTYYKLKKLFYIKKIQLDTNSIRDSQFLHLSTLKSQPKPSLSFKRRSRSFKDRQNRIQFLLQNGLESGNINGFTVD